MLAAAAGFFGFAFSFDSWRLNCFLLPAFEIHGGAKGFYDFGPVGGRMRSRINQRWVDHWLELGNVVELSCPTITPFAVLEASGHVGEFSDFFALITNFL